MKKLYFAVVLSTLLFSVTTVFAHPGRTDSSGCHTCKTNCPNWGLSYGEYHCHNSKGTVQPVAPVRSTYGENGTGYVTPAPEYKIPKVVPAPKAGEVKKSESKKVEVKTAPVPQEIKTGGMEKFFNWLF